MSHTYNNASYVLLKDIAPTSAHEVLVSGLGFDIFGHCCGCRNEAIGCCWMCDVTPGRVDEVSRESSWLQPAHRKSPWQALLAAPKVSPLFSAPFVGVDCIQMDWLHVVDIGVALQFLGSLFKVFMAKFPGTADEQSRQLFRLIQDHYVSSDAHSRLDELKPSMIKDPKKNSRSSGPRRAKLAAWCPLRPCWLVRSKKPKPSTACTFALFILAPVTNS